MTISLVGRWNLGGAPYDPAMKDEGVLIYRPSAATVRKAVYQVSDAALGTVTNPGARALPYFGTAEIFGDYYYPPFRQNPYANPPWLTAIHTTTGAETQFATGALNWGSYQMRTMIFETAGKVAQQSLVTGAGNNASSMWGDTPPTANTFTAGNAASGDMSSLLPAVTRSFQMGGSESVLYMGERVTIDAGPVHYHEAYWYLWNGAAVTLTMIPRFLYVYVNKGAGGTSWSKVTNPARMIVHDNKIWYLRKRSDTNSIWVGSVNLANMPNSGYTSEVLTVTTVGVGTIGTNTPWTAAMHIDPTYGRIYMVDPLAATSGGFPRPNDLHAATLPWTNPTSWVSPDAGGTTNALITGIWTFPPYVYITKVAGNTFGNQLIKLYDSELGPRRSRRRRGGEFWGIVPEVSTYFG